MLFFFFNLPSGDYYEEANKSYNELQSIRLFYSSCLVHECENIKPIRKWPYLNSFGLQKWKDKRVLWRLPSSSPYTLRRGMTCVFRSTNLLVNFTMRKKRTHFMRWDWTGYPSSFLRKYECEKLKTYIYHVNRYLSESRYIYFVLITWGRAWWFCTL